jgi:glycine betaine catabolism B
MIPVVDKLLNKLTMYKVVLFGLLFLTVVSLFLSYLNIIFYEPLSLIFTLVILLSFSFFSNILIAKVLKVVPNTESSIITALILFFILIPIENLSEIWVYILAALLAVGSKYLFVKNKKHIFNPAAFSLVILGLIGVPAIGWWVGNSDLFPFVLLIGFLILRKVRKFLMFSVYMILALTFISVFAQINGRELQAVISEAIRSYPLLFLGAVMLIEPLTLPPRRAQQIIYAGIVGLLSGFQFKLGPIFSSPELALIIGNLYSFIVSSRKRFELILLSKKELAPNLFEFSFRKSADFSFIPGQYGEWMLGGLRPDMRGIRRFFTIASAPTEEDIKLGVRINDRRSKYKDKLAKLSKGEKIIVDNIMGDFTIDQRMGKYIFIAGGIGITPFRSIVKNAVDKNEKLDAILFYSCRNNNEFVYKDMFDSAKKIGLKTIYICTSEKQRLSGEILKNEAPDYKKRIIYLSGSNSLVNEIKLKLFRMGISPLKIKTDYFSGY